MTTNDEVVDPVEEQHIIDPVIPKTGALLSNPFINYLFNNQDFKRAGPLKEVVRQLCENPADYTIFIPSTIFLTMHVDSETGTPYSELCKDLDFILTHIVRVNVAKEPRIRTHKEFTTLNNKTVIIKSNTITSFKGFKHPIHTNILRQEFIRGFANYVPFGTCFHIIYISDCLVGNYKFIGETKNLMAIPNILKTHNPQSLSLEYSQKPKNIKPFELIIGEYSGLLDISEKFRTLFVEYTFKKCKKTEDLEKSFVAIMRRGSAMFNTLDAETFHLLLEKYSEDELRESVYNYLEMNIYDKFWSKFLKFCPNTKDETMKMTFDKLKWLSITEIGLSDNIIGNNKVLATYIRKVVSAIREFKKLTFANTCSLKCSIIINTVDILSSGSTIDADTLVCLLIFVICLSAVPNLNNHIKYIRKYAYSETNTEKGILGYALSTLEISTKYFHDEEKLQILVSKSLQNEVLWRLIGSVSSDQSNPNKKQDDENTFKQLEKLLQPFNVPNKIIPLESFVKSRTLEGESCLMYALKQNNEELMNVLLQFEYIFTLDDILEDQNIEGSNLLAVALNMKHPSISVLSQIILGANPDEIEKYVNEEDSNKRSVGHFLHTAHMLIPDFGGYINWTTRDFVGNTPFMVYIRCYDHPKYDEMMSFTIPIVKQWYVQHGKLFSHRDHLDKKGNTLMHTIRDSTTLELFLKTFKGLEMNYLNDSNQSAVSLAVRYNRIDNVEILIKDPRVFLGVVDPLMFMSPLDYVKLERWGESVNRNIAKMLEINFILTEYGENLDIACVRARFEPEYGLCCYFRVVNKLKKSDIILVPFSSLVKVFKLMKKENPCIPFDFNNPDLWFPKHLYVSMKGNINSSNKLKINTLINNLNLLIQALYKNGTLDHTESLQNYLLVPQEPCKLEIKEIEERKVIKSIYTKNLSYRRHILLDRLKFKRMIINSDDIVAYEAFLNYTMVELTRFSELYRKFYHSFTLSDVEAKDLDKLRTDMPWIVEKTLKYRECRIEDSSDIFLDKTRLLTASVEELVRIADDMRTNKIKKWKKLTNDLKSVRSELDRIAGSGVDGSALPSPYNGPVDSNGLVKTNRKYVLSRVFKQIDILTGELDDEDHVEEFRIDILKVISVSKNNNESNKNEDGKEDNKSSFVSEDDFTETLNELLNLDDTGIGSWFVEKRRISYVKRLLETFLKFRIEIIEIDLDLRRLYENLAMFVSKFYQYRIDVFKNAYGDYAKGKIAELRREVEAWELGLREHQDKLTE